MAFKYTLQEFANKCDWEGGLLDTVFDYGLGPEDVEDPKLAYLLRQLKAIEPIIDEIRSILPGAEDEYE